jgi:hypothetical protein
LRIFPKRRFTREISADTNEKTDVPRPAGGGFEMMITAQAAKAAWAQSVIIEKIF